MKLRTVNLILSIISLSIFLSRPALAFNPPADYLEAVELCDKADLRPVEGLWSYPEDDVTVIIFRNADKKGVYDIYVVEAADCSLAPQMRIGELHSSADPDKFNLKLFTIIKNGILSMPMEATAVFSENKESLTVRKRSFKIRINPIRLLPSFWRIVSVNLKSNEPAPQGMVKIYPSYDGNQSSRREPRYL